MNIKHWADTSALLHQPLLNPDISIAISTITLSELEHIKNSDRDENIKYKAREAVRSILTSTNFEVITTVTFEDGRVIDFTFII